jgi:TolB-like protein/Flp pilus assembly protein TadD/predicted Ser/Thr protein kinase
LTGGAKQLENNLSGSIWPPLEAQIKTYPSTAIAMTLALISGTRLGRYEIRSELGKGGMGEVYLAEDTALHRNVALKVLPAVVAINQDRMRRFKQEATAAASLNHPNIAHIYEIGEAGEVNFIAMEYVDGATLRDKIHREHAELPKLLRALEHVAEGLAKAHAAGIVHRDLKPDNIMVTHDGHGKILDFGLAKLIEPSQFSGLSDTGSDVATAILPEHSKPGVILGTVGYMSPEQAQGKTNQIDHRSDIFSFGCILYEVATGQKAFEGEDPLDSLHKIVHAPTPNIGDANPRAPSELQRIVRRCLAKDPNERYQTIKDAAIELKEIRHELAGAGMDVTLPPASVTQAGNASETATDSSGRASSAEYIVSGIKQHKLIIFVVLTLLVVGAAGLGAYLYTRRSEVAIESIAVLPFENQNKDPNIDYLSDGLTDTIINSLTQLPNLKVIARSSVFRYKGKQTDAITVANELGVRAVVTGRIIQRGDSLTIGAELIDAHENKQLWGEQYERRVSELLAVQRDIAQQITGNLRLQLSSGEQGRISKHYTDNAEAYQHYLNGRFHWNKRTGDALKKSIEYFNRAIEKDPSYALAYAGLADAYVLLPPYSAGSPLESLPRAKAAARKAVELDDTLAEAHTSLAQALHFGWSFNEAEKEFQRAISLNPNYATAHHWYGFGSLQTSKRFDEAISALKRAQELDPLSLIISTDLGHIYLNAGQYDRAIEQLQKTLVMDEDFYYAHWCLGLAYEMKGSFREAQAEYQKALQLNDDPYVLGLLAHLFAASGKKDQAIKTLQQLEETSRQRYVPASSFAFIYAELNEMDKAFHWLEKCYQEHCNDLISIEFEPLFKNVRSDPRFAELARRVFRENLR